MIGWEKWLRGFWVLFLVGASAVALAVSVGPRTSQDLEINSNYKAAVTSQSKAEPLKFIRTFGSSDLVGTLIVSLKPEVARQVCADLRGGGPRKAREACEKLREAFTAQASATATEIGPAADIAMVDPVSAGAAGVASADEPQVSPRDGGTDRASGPYAFHRPVAATAPAEAIAAVLPPSDSVVILIPPDDGPQDSQDARGRDKAGDTDFFNRQDAATAPAEVIAAM